MKNFGKKLNVGSGITVMDGYINIDDGYDYPEGFGWMREHAESAAEFLEMDGNDMTFADNEFGELYSNQCVGQYVTNYKELARVLKPSGIVRFGVWNERVADVVAGLLKNGIRITSLELLNGGPEDDTRTYMIEGWKV